MECTFCFLKTIGIEWPSLFVAQNFHRRPYIPYHAAAPPIRERFWKKLFPFPPFLFIPRATQWAAPAPDICFASLSISRSGWHIERGRRYRGGEGKEEKETASKQNFPYTAAAQGGIWSRIHQRNDQRRNSLYDISDEENGQSSSTVQNTEPGKQQQQWVWASTKILR